MKPAFSTCITTFLALYLGCSTAFSQELLEEVVVTAQKREQRLEDVGISITAIGPTELAAYGVRETTDIVNLVPSLQFNKFSEGSVVFNIRGVSQNDYGDQQEPPVAVYHDDSYSSTLNLAGFPVFDLQRVEVLRGPQGTLFGRNATGGAIQYVTNKPTKDFDSYFTATVGQYREFDLEGAVSGPLVPIVQGRFAFERTTNRGYLADISDGSRRAGADNYALRTELAAQPSAAINTLLTMRYARNLHETSAGMYSWVAAYPGPHGLGVYAGPNTPSPFGTCNGCDQTGYRNPAINPVWGGDPWKVASTGPHDFDRTLRGASFKIDGTAGSINLVSITDYLNMNKFYEEQSNTSPIDEFNYYESNKYSQVTEEVRASAQTGINEWVVGAFYMHLNGHYAAGFPFVQIGYLPAANFQQWTRSTALFAQDELKFADHWSLIAGIRGWRDQRYLNYHIADNFGTTVDYNPTLYPGVADPTFKNYSAKLELDHKFTDETLGYLSWNRGTKSGGFTVSVATPADTSPAGIQAFTNAFAYHPEILTAYEIGVKSTLFGGTTTVNADAFYYDYKDYQGYFTYGLTQTIVNTSARDHGVELEIDSHPVERLTISTGISSLRSHVNNVALPDGTLTERELPQAPTWSGHVLARYEVPVIRGYAALQWVTTYTGRMCFSLLCGPLDVEPGHAVSDAQLSYRPSVGNWDVALSVKNLTDKEYRFFDTDISFAGVTQSIYAPPRWFRITYTMKFGGTRH